MIKAVVFDFFGVITDDSFWQYAGNPSHNAEILNLSNRTNLGKIHWQDFIEEIAGLTGQNADSIEAKYKAENISPRMSALIRQLNQTGLKTGLLSNAHHEYLQPLIKRTGLENFLDVVIISSKVGLVKPDARIYRELINELKIPAEEIVFIDDQTSNVEAAARLGFNGIVYKDFESLVKQLGSLDIL